MSNQHISVAIEQFMQAFNNSKYRLNEELKNELINLAKEAFNRDQNSPVQYHRQSMDEEVIPAVIFVLDQNRVVTILNHLTECLKQDTSQKNIAHLDKTRYSSFGDRFGLNTSFSSTLTKAGVGVVVGGIPACLFSDFLNANPVYMTLIWAAIAVSWFVMSICEAVYKGYKEHSKEFKEFSQKADNLLEIMEKPVEGYRRNSFFSQVQDDDGTEKMAKEIELVASNRL